MKKIAALFIGLSILCSGVLSGCKSGKTKESKESTTATSATQTTTESTTEATTEETDSTVPIFKDLNKDWYEKVDALYLSKSPDREKGVYVLAEGIRGNGMYDISETEKYGMQFELMYFSNSYNGIQLFVFPNTEVLVMCLQLEYDDGTAYRVYGNYDNRVGLKDAEKYIDEFISGTGAFGVEDDSALASHSEEVKKDIAILYARLIAMSESAFAEANVTLEDGGIPLGTKYRSTDPKTLLTMEHEVKNEHKFVNGVCSDCGMQWMEYFYEAVGELGKYTEPEGYRSIYGEISPYMIDMNDYVQYQAPDKTYSELFYNHIADEDHMLQCHACVGDQGDGIVVTIDFNLAEGQVMIDTATYADMFEYNARITANPGELDKAFASKEAFAEAIEVDLFIRNEGGPYINAWAELSEEAIQAKFKDFPQCTYYSKADIIDIMWENHVAMFESLEAGMVGFGTTMAEGGINWKSA